MKNKNTHTHTENMTKILSHTFADSPKASLIFRSSSLSFSWCNASSRALARSCSKTAKWAFFCKLENEACDWGERINCTFKQVKRLETLVCLLLMSSHTYMTLIESIQVKGKRWLGFYCCCLYRLNTFIAQLRLSKSVTSSTVALNLSEEQGSDVVVVVDVELFLFCWVGACSPVLIIFLWQYSSYRITCEYFSVLLLMGHGKHFPLSKSIKISLFKTLHSNKDQVSLTKCAQTWITAFCPHGGSRNKL